MGRGVCGGGKWAGFTLCQEREKEIEIERGRECGGMLCDICYMLCTICYTLYVICND